MPDASAALPLAGRTVLGIFAHPDDESLACGGTLARLADAGCRVVIVCASHGEAGSISDPALVPDGDLGRVRARELRDAAAVLGVAEVIVLDHPDGDLRWDDVPELHAEIVALIQRYRPDAVITFAEDGLYWHLDHIGVHERTYTAVLSLRRRRAAALLRHDAARRHARGRRGRARQGRRAARLQLLGHRARRVRRRRQPADLRDRRARLGRRASSRRCAAIARRWARTTRSPGSTRTRRGAGSASNSSGARRSTPPATRCSSISAKSPMLIETLDVLRCPYCGGRLALVDSLFHRRTARRDPRRHPRLPLLHLPARRRHPGAAPAAGVDGRARSPPGRPARSGAPRDVRARRRRAGRGVRRGGLVGHRDLSRHRRGARTELRGRLFSLPLLRPDLHRRAGGGARGRRDRARRPAARDRHLRRIGTRDAHAARSVGRAAGARRSVLREGLAGAALHRARLRAGLLRRQRADAVRARRVRLRDVHRRVHVHLDEAAVRRRDGAAGRRPAGASSRAPC